MRLSGLASKSWKPKTAMPAFAQQDAARLDVAARDQTRVGHEERPGEAQLGGQLAEPFESAPDRRRPAVRGRKSNG